MSKIPRQPVRMPESDGAERVMRLLAELSAADEPPALSDAVALVLTVTADGHVDITSNVHVGQVAAILRTAAMQVIAGTGMNGREELYRYADGVGRGEIPPAVVTVDPVPSPTFAWQVRS